MREGVSVQQHSIACAKEVARARCKIVNVPTYLPTYLPIGTGQGGHDQIVPPAT